MGCAINVAKRFDRNKGPLFVLVLVMLLLLLGPPVPITTPPPPKPGPPGPPRLPGVPPGMLVVMKLLPEVPPLGWNSWILNLSSPLSRR